MYQVLVERSADKDLKRLSSGFDLAWHSAPRSRPRPASARQPQTRWHEHDWRVRVGDYRIIYEIADVIRVVRVQRIRHRREVYR